MKRIIKYLPGKKAAKNTYLPEYISNENLSQDMIPPRGAPWSDIAWFSLTFNGYQKNGSFNRCTTVACTRECRTLSEIREYLFSELSIRNRMDKDPDEVSLEFMYELLDRIREKLRINERD